MSATVFLNHYTDVSETSQFINPSGCPPFARKTERCEHAFGDDLQSGEKLMGISKSFDAYPRVLSSAHRYGYPLLAMVRRDFKIRYAPTVLGLGWAVLQPLIFLVLYTLVFTVILKVRFHPEAGVGSSVLYVVCGFLPYMALSEGIQRGSTSLTENSSLLHKVIFPAEVLPAVGVIGAAVTELIGLVLLVGLAGFFGVRPSVWLVFLPLIVLMRIAITLGFAWLVSVLNVFFSDLSQFLGLALMAWMFLTPIFYPVENIPDALIWLLHLNPLHHLTVAYRAVLLEMKSPLPTLLILTGWAVGISSLGVWFFRRTVERAKDFI
jgi:lipopolysaccharide transport system permease protein